MMCDAGALAAPLLPVRYLPLLALAMDLSRHVEGLADTHDYELYGKGATLTSHHGEGESADVDDVDAREFVLVILGCVCVKCHVGYW